MTIKSIENYDIKENIEDFKIEDMIEIYDKNYYTSDTSDASDIPDSNNFI